LLKLVELYPDDERGHTLLGNFYYGQQDWPDAIAQYQDAIKIDPNYSQPYNQLGYAQRIMGNFTDAEAAFKKYIELIPDDPNPYDSYAELLMKMGEFQKSIDHYKQALAIDSHFVASYLGIATDLDFLGQHAEARQELDQLLKVARSDGDRRAAHFAMAVSFADEGKLEDALVQIDTEYEMADKIDDASAKAGDLINMGSILLEEGKPEQAQSKYDDAFKQVEDSDLSKDIKENANRIYLYNCAKVSIDMGKLDDAESYIKEFTRAAQEIKNPLQIKLAHELMGMMAYEKKDYTTALAEFGQSNLQDPYNLYRVALTYEANGDRANAKKFCTKVVKFNALNNLNYAFIRNDAKQMLASME
jgi:tetratricopeptide (TPR) repeat protein